MGAKTSRDSATDYVRSQEEGKTATITGESIEHRQQKAFAEVRDSCNQKVNDIEKSLKRDKSVPNLIHLLSALIDLEGTNKMECVNRIVESMGVEWRNLMSHEEKMTKVVGARAMAKLKNTRLRYFYLLLRTKSVIVELLEESDMRKENVADALGVVTTAKDDPAGDGTLKDKERLLFQESITLLSKWIDHSELVKVAEEWNALSNELQEQKNMFRKVCDKYKKKNWWLKVAIGFGAVIVFAAVIAGLVIATSGLSLLGACAIAWPSCGVCGVGFSKWYCAHSDDNDEMAENIERITFMLHDYIQNCMKIEKEVIKMDESGKKIRKRKIDFNAESCVIIHRSLKKIEKYLDDYIEQGNEAVESIEEACKEFLNQEIYGV